MRYWFDTEFIEDGKTIDLISIGIVGEDGRSLYWENAECDLSRANEWVVANVFPHLVGSDAQASRGDIAMSLIEFAGPKPEFWAYYGAYDWVVLCQLFGRMIDLPASWPMFVRDVRQLCDARGNPPLPPQSTTEHHALADARWTKEAWEFLQSLR